MRALRQRSGANALEFALIMPVYCALMSGIFDYGWMFFVKSAMDSSVAWGCRQGSLVDPGTGEVNMPTVLATAESDMIAGLAFYGATCDASCDAQATVYGTNPSRGITCVLSREWVPLFGFYTEPLVLEATSVMRLEWQR